MFKFLSKIFGDGSDSSSNKMSAEAIAEKLAPYISPQIAKLDSEDQQIFVSDIAYAYVYMYATSLTGASLNLFEVRDVLKLFFQGENYDFQIENSFNTITSSSDFTEKCSNILPIVQKEIEGGDAAYFMKYTRSSNARMAKPFDHNYDPSKMAHAYLEVD